MCVIMLGAVLKIPVTVDRIEGQFAVLEFPGSIMRDIEIELLEKPREGEKFQLLLQFCGNTRFKKQKLKTKSNISKSFSNVSGKNPVSLK